jgi:hypothetical protein
MTSQFATSKVVNARMQEVAASLGEALQQIAGQRLPFLLPFLLLVQTDQVVQVRADWTPVDGRTLIDGAVEWAGTSLGGTLNQFTVDISL